jgi:hypothetical protein
VPILGRASGEKNSNAENSLLIVLCFANKNEDSAAALFRFFKGTAYSARAEAEDGQI